MIKKRTIKYINRMGQKTGTSKKLKNVIPNEIKTALIQEYQNLNSGNLLANGLYIIRNNINKLINKY